MPGPTITFAFMIATFYGALFHVVRGGDIRRLALYLLSGWVGFGLGHLVGGLVSFSVLNVGPLRLLPATAGAVVALVFSQFLATRSINTG